MKTLFSSIALISLMLGQFTAPLLPADTEPVDSKIVSIVESGSKGWAAKSFEPIRTLQEEEGTPTVVPTDTATEPSSTPAFTLEGTATPSIPSSTPTPAQISNTSTGLSDLFVEFSADPNQAKAGDQVTFTLKIVNNSKSDVTGLRFSNILPIGFEYVPADSQGFILMNKPASYPGLPKQHYCQAKA